MKKTIKVLAIGNSFSNDAMRYLHKIAKKNGTDMKTVNLYIGGCPLSTHYVNMNNDAASYDFEYNGDRTGIKVSIKQALQSDVWDIVTVQQVSSESVDYETYQPYLNKLVSYIKYHAPKAEIMVHQTWAYEDGSARLCYEMGYSRHEDMFMDIKNAYSKAAHELGDVQIIPSGQTMENLIDAGVSKVHRDTFHATFGTGRYALGLVWYEILTGSSCLNDNFSDFDEPLTEKEAYAARTAAHNAAEKYRRK